MTQVPAQQMPSLQRPLRTQRLVLRPLEASDAHRVAHLVGVWDVARNLARVPHPYRLQDAETWLASLPEQAASGTGFIYAVCIPDGGLIGCVGLHQEGEDGLFELGYWLGMPYWGNGLMTEAVAAVRDFAWQTLKQTCLTSGHFLDNPASGRVLEKLGFSYRGENTEQFCCARGESVVRRNMRWLSPDRRLS